MQVLSVPSRAFLFCFEFVFGKVSWGKSTWLLLTRKSKVAIQDVTPSVTPLLKMTPSVLLWCSGGSLEGM